MYADDRGNVVDFNDENDIRNGYIDREADPIPGVDSEYTSSFSCGDTCGAEVVRSACSNDYIHELAVAIICDLVRGEPEAKEHAVLFLKECLDI